MFLIQQQDGRYATITAGDLSSAGVPAFMFWALEYAQRGPTGGGALVQQYPQVLEAARIGGAVFLAAYALLAARRALRPASTASAT